MRLCPAPNASKKRMFFASQEENIILNSRPTNCQGPLSRRVLPILNDETLEVTAEDHEWTREFLNLMATSYSESPVIEPLTDFIQLMTFIRRWSKYQTLNNTDANDFTHILDNTSQENGPVQFNYESWLTDDQEKLVFKAKAGDTPLVVKFTQRYNALVCRQWACTKATLCR
ncbi:5587_t:CDS:2 [Paraglomus occultum]|uniref:5587_t:CDS:1 n=1 Tax=Paraglomus occultum TaxID=144539 RepID=A0A9N8ZRY3_9GLOM|nr:5587_t:CDS:2 [Paraglomus occultum]